MGANHKQAILVCLATTFAVSGFWWYGLDFAIKGKVSVATQRGENAGYTRAVTDGRHSDKYLFEKNVALEHEIGRLRQEISMLMQSPSIETLSAESRDSSYTRPPTNRTQRTQAPADRN